MANISTEIKNLQDAVYGEEVRGSMVSLANKLNTEVENNTQGVNEAITDTNNAAAYARSSGDAALVSRDAANTAATNANTAAANTEATRQDVLNRLAAGEFKGEKGDTGEKGDQGESGIMASTAGMFSLHLDPATGNLYAEYPDGAAPPTFEYDADTGKLYYVTD